MRIACSRARGRFTPARTGRRRGLFPLDEAECGSAPAAGPAAVVTSLARGRIAAPWPSTSRGTRRRGRSLESRSWSGGSAPPRIDCVSAGDARDRPSKRPVRRSQRAVGVGVSRGYKVLGGEGGPRRARYSVLGHGSSTRRSMAERFARQCDRRGVRSTKKLRGTQIPRAFEVKGWPGIDSARELFTHAVARSARRTGLLRPIAPLKPFVDRIDRAANALAAWSRSLRAHDEEAYRRGARHAAPARAASRPVAAAPCLRYDCTHRPLPGMREAADRASECSGVARSALPSRARRRRL